MQTTSPNFDNAYPGFETTEVSSFAEDAYLAYALTVVKDRALVNVQDGMKPVQRRILYAMADIKLDHKAKPVKCARIVGDALGKYHPHGDQSVYDALVRQAQDFTMRYPLVNGQGNFGSRDGDSAAAMRYTEAKLTPIAQLLLSELNEEVVRFRPNYDGAFKEPTLLPSRLPMLLLNGTMGIAVGMASDIYPHNLGEVANAIVHLVRNPDAPLSEILTHIQGPDFPTGGQLSSSASEIEQVYTTGTGPLRLRCRWTVEELARGQWQIVITELPYRTSATNFLQELNELSSPTLPAGKKQLTPKQLALKTTTLEFIDRALDESSKDAAVRIVIHPRTSKVDPNALMEFLLASTCLETSISLNMTLLDLAGSPSRFGLKDVLSQWITFRMETLTKRCTYEKRNATERAHILEGRIKARKHIQTVIRIIQEAEDPRASLIEELALSEVQANDVLDMRLRSISRLEAGKLEEECTALHVEIARLAAILASESNLRMLLIKEVMSDSKLYGDERRTLIQPVAKRTQAAAAIVRAAVDEPLTVVLTKHSFIKAFKGHGLESAQFQLKNGDEVLSVTETRTTQPLFILDTTGRVFTLDATLLPSGRMEAAPASTLVELSQGARLAHVFSAQPSEKLLFATEFGYGLVVEGKSLVANRKAGKAFLTLESGDVALPPKVVNAELSGYLALGSTDGRMLVIDLEEVKERASGGKGVQLMSIKEGGQRLSAAVPLQSLSQLCILDVKTTKGVTQLKYRENHWVDFLGKRARAGKPLSNKGVLLNVRYSPEEG